MKIRIDDFSGKPIEVDADYAQLPDTVLVNMALVNKDSKAEMELRRRAARPPR